MCDAPARSVRRRHRRPARTAVAGLALVLTASLTACGGRDGGGGGGPVPTVPAETTAVTVAPG